MAIFRVSNLSHGYDYELFDNINFELDKGDSISIVGVSGSGKSSLMHICSTFLKPKRGKVELFGKDLYALSSDEILAIRREKIGIVFQSHYLFKGFDAFENVELVSFLNDTPADEQLLKELNILHVINQKVGDLSGGQQQRVSIARVLSKRPKIIFADEPTGNLDSETANDVMSVFFNYIKNNGAMLVLVTHDTDLAKRCKYTIKL